MIFHVYMLDHKFNSEFGSATEDISVQNLWMFIYEQEQEVNQFIDNCKNIDEWSHAKAVFKSYEMCNLI